MNRKNILFFIAHSDLHTTSSSVTSNVSPSINRLRHSLPQWTVLQQALGNVWTQNKLKTGPEEESGGRDGSRPGGGVGGVIVSF